MEKMSTYSFNVLSRLILSWRYSQNLWPNRYAYLILNSGYSNKAFPQLMFYFILSAGVAYAKTLGWFLKMCISDAATFFSCIIAGTASCSLLWYGLNCDNKWCASAFIVFQPGYVGLNHNLFGFLLVVTASTTGKCTQQACQSQRSPCFLCQPTNCKIFT